MGQIEWAMWANEQAVISSFLLMLGGIIGVAGYKEFNYWQCAAVALVLSLLLLVLEWPRSKRKKGNTIERRFQHVLTPVVNKMGCLTRNYFVRFILLMLCSVPCCFLLATIMAGVGLQVSGLIYFVAAIKGEEWKPCMPKSPESGGPEAAGAPTIPPPPTEPPPRRPDTAAHNDGGVHNGGYAVENRV